MDSHEGKAINRLIARYVDSHKGKKINGLIARYVDSHEGKPINRLIARYVDSHKGKTIKRLIAIDLLTQVFGLKSLFLGIFVAVSQPSRWIVFPKPHAIYQTNNITHNLQTITI